MNTSVRIIVYLIVLGIIGSLVWRFYIEPKMDTATAPTVESTSAPANGTPPASPEPATELAAGTDALAQPKEPTQP